METFVVEKARGRPVKGAYFKGTPGFPGVILSHGANNDMDHYLLTRTADLLQEEGWSTLRITFSFRVQNRPPRIQELLEELDFWKQFLQARAPMSRLVLVGKSLGGYASTVYVTQRDPEGEVRAVGVFGYPFQNPEGTPIYAEHLTRIRVPTLFLQGAQDPLGPPERIQAFLHTLPGVPIEVQVIPDTDHSFHHHQDEAVDHMVRWLLDHA